MPAPTLRAELDTVETTTTLTMRDAPPIPSHESRDGAPAGWPFQPSVLEVYVCDDHDEDEPPYVEVTAREGAVESAFSAAWTNDRDHDHGTDLADLPPWLRVLVTDLIPEEARPW